MLLYIGSLGLFFAQWSFSVASLFNDESESLSRRLAALPKVVGVFFQDFDLEDAEIGGKVVWTQPADTTEIIQYKVYLADAAGTPSTRRYLGYSPVGQTAFQVPAGTSFNAPFSHVFVHSKSILGESPNGVGCAVCDVTLQDSLFLVNDAPTGASWAVADLEFFREPSCSGSPMLWAAANSSGDALGHGAEDAVDGVAATAWESSCGACAVGEASIGVVGVCAPHEVRCVRIRQCGQLNLQGTCPASAGRTHRISLAVRGEVVHTWKNLPPGDLWGTLREELLAVTGRRRRAFAMHMSVDDSSMQAQTNTGFTSR